MPHTFSGDGKLRFGDSVMMMNKRTNGFMVCDMGDKMVSSDEQYACTTTKKETGPCGRSVMNIEKVNNDEGDDVVHYGE